MKARSGIPLVWLLAFCAVHASPQTRWNRVSAFRLDWNAHKDVQVIFEIPDSWSDPGDFTRIRIVVPGQKAFSLSNKSGWVKYPEGGLQHYKGLAAKSLVRSPYALALKVAENRTALFLTGFGYASSPGSLDVLELQETGFPRSVLHRAELGLSDVYDIDSDGIADVVGYPCLSPQFGDGLQTYDPFNVYKFDITPGATPRSRCRCRRPTIYSTTTVGREHNAVKMLPSSCTRRMEASRSL